MVIVSVCVKTNRRISKKSTTSKSLELTNHPRRTSKGEQDAHFVKISVSVGAKPKLVGLTFRQISHNKEERNEKVFDFLVT